MFLNNPPDDPMDNPWFEAIDNLVEYLDYQETSIAPLPWPEFWELARDWEGLDCEYRYLTRHHTQKPEEIEHKLDMMHRIEILLGY